MATPAELLKFAKQRHQAGDLAGADSLYRQVLQVEPAQAEAIALLALACHQRNALPEAESWYRRSLALRPTDADVHFRLALVLMGLSRPDDAIVHFREAARLRPDAPEIWNNLGNVLFLQNKTAEAVSCYRSAVKLRPDYAEACQNLGNALREDDRQEEGLTWYREAVRLRPDFPKSRMNLAAALLETGETREAEGHLREYLRLVRRAPRVLSVLAANDLYSEADPGPDELKMRLADPKLSPTDASHLHFTIGRLLDKAGRAEEAFPYFMESNRLRREQLRGTSEAFDAAEFVRLVDRLIDLFTPEWFENHRGLGVDTEEPVFAVGMPRSGSTLVEQILSYHPDMAGVGELRDLPRLTETLSARLGSADPYPNCLSGIEPATVRMLAEEYLTRVRDLAGPAKRIVDKMLVNFLHLGFIALLFPRARVIHCRRDPLDTCVSCYLQIFRGMSFTLDLDDLALYYRHYERLMAHWRTVRPLPMLEVVYEELIADVEKGSRQLIEFCGLPWDERCLRYYENPRTVRTVSKLQVRQPVYTSSVGRWRRYGAVLEPLRKALGMA